MKTMKYFLSMAALALVGAMTVSCSSDDNIIEQPQQPETKNNVVTLTTTVGLDGGAGTTRALDINYTAKTLTKTFAVDETMVLRYKNKKGDWVKAVSNALEAKDIADGSKSATFTFTLDNPDKTQNVDYIYPAAIVNQSGNMDEAALFGSQDGTLNKIASTFDYSRKIGAWDGDNLPSLTLENQLAILAITLTNANGSSDITSSITGMTLSDGTKNYNVTCKAVAGRIYVAIFPTEDATITVTATNGTKNYTKTLTTKTYAKGNVYPVSWRMTELPEGALPGLFSVRADKKVYFSKGNLQATYDGSGSGWTWAFAANQWNYIGNAEGNTKVSGSDPFVTGYTGSSTTVDLFGWSTSTTYLGIHKSRDDGDYSGDFVDWGSHADVTAGIGSGWCTLSKDEWLYLFYGRSDAENKYGYATVNGVYGIIFLPDAFVDPKKNNGSDAFVGSATDWVTNVYTAANWALMEKNGAVFLPAAGYRDEADVFDDGDDGWYWSSSAKGGDEAYYLYFAESDESDDLVVDNFTDRYNGHSVRLVRPVQ